MIDKFDSATGYGYVAAAASLLLMPFDDDPPRDLIMVMFTAGPAGGRPNLDDHLAVANAERKAIIHLEFEVGRERDGPSNVVVVTQHEGKWRGWTECDLWSESDVQETRSNAPTIIMPKRENYCFTYDGADLFRVPGRPTDSFEVGVARARKNLKFLAAEIRLLKAKLGN